MLSIQEIHYYTKLVEKNKIKNLILCPFNKLDIVITKFDEDDMPYFYCLSCKSVFKLSKDVEDIIKIAIDKYLNSKNR